GSPGAVPGSTAPAQAESQTVDITTDVFKLRFDTRGAQLVRAELLRYNAPETEDQPMVLLDNVAGSTYVVQTGVVGAPAGESFPTHLTPFSLVSSETTLPGESLDVVFEGESAGVKVRKIYTLHKGRYDISVRHEITNTSGAAVAPSVYLQIV